MNLKSLAIKAMANVASKFEFLTRASKGQLLRAAGLTTVFAMAGVWFGQNSGVFIDVSDIRCLPEYVYIGYPKTKSFERGQIVSFIATERTMFGLFTGKRAAKIIAGLPGDMILSNDSGAYVNGTKVGDRSSVTVKNLTNKHLVAINMNRRLLPGELFVVGTLPRSFDSRYWGPVPSADVDRLVKAVF
jgi:conjugal transfer pilin signal peptidase TrbI